MSKGIRKVNAVRVLTDEPRFSEKQMIEFGEFVSRRKVIEIEVAFFFNACYEVKEVGNE